MASNPGGPENGWLHDYRGRRLRPATAAEAERSRRSTVVDRGRRLIALRELGDTWTEADLGFVLPA